MVRVDLMAEVTGMLRVLGMDGYRTDEVGLILDEYYVLLYSLETHTIRSRLYS